MSTVEVKMFSLVCDGCGADANEGTDFVAYLEDFASREIAHEDGWLTTDDGNDWCPDCIEWDEEGNEQRPKLPRPSTGGREAVSQQERAETWYASAGKFIPHQDVNTRRGLQGFSGCHDAAIAGYRAGEEQSQQRAGFAATTSDLPGRLRNLADEVERGDEEDSGLVLMLRDSADKVVELVDQNNRLRAGEKRSQARVAELEAIIENLSDYEIQHAIPRLAKDKRISDTTIASLLGIGAPATTGKGEP